MRKPQYPETLRHEVYLNSTETPRTLFDTSREMNTRERPLYELLNRGYTWLMQYAFGSYWLTASLRSQAFARMLALAAYANCITEIPLAFEASGEDLPARRLLDAFSFLVSDCVVNVSPVHRPTASINVGLCEIDKRTDVLAELPLLPSLTLADRGTAATLRRDMVADARERGQHILTNGAAWSKVVPSVARVAGGVWERAADWIMHPDRMPVSVPVDDWEASNAR